MPLARRALARARRGTLGLCWSQLSPLRLVRRKQVTRLASLSQLLYHRGARSRAPNRGRGRQDVSGSQGPCLRWCAGRGGERETGSRCARLRGCAGGLLPPGLWEAPSTSVASQHLTPLVVFVREPFGFLPRTFFLYFPLTSKEV